MTKTFIVSIYYQILVSEHEMMLNFVPSKSRNSLITMMSCQDKTHMKKFSIYNVKDPNSLHDSFIGAFGNPTVNLKYENLADFARSIYLSIADSWFPYESNTAWKDLSLKIRNIRLIIFQQIRKILAQILIVVANLGHDSDNSTLLLESNIACTKLIRKNYSKTKRQEQLIDLKKLMNSTLLLINLSQMILMCMSSQMLFLNLGNQFLKQMM